MNDHEEEENTSDEVLHFSMQFALDQDGFFRRACSQCGLNFKVKSSAQDLSSLLAPTFRRIENDYGVILTADEEQSSQNAEADQLYCPYCGHVDIASNMVTDELDQYVHRWAYREIIYPKLKSLLDGFTDAFGGSRRSSRDSLFSIEVSFEHDMSGVPLRPISGPELPDMVHAQLLCCGKAIKIADGWSSEIYCPYCGLELILQ
jgi:predicted RNA-binding Zn-ribbon protein involved in translation (DUF1610 family)